MAGCGYHPPQFSEDAVWLPPWLQPHQMPFLGDQTCSDQIALHQPSSKNSSRYPDSDGRDCLLLASGDCRCSGFHLFLSGEDVSPLGCTPASRTVSQFDLHLSPEDISLIPSHQPCNGIPIGLSKTNEGSFDGSFPKISVLQLEPHAQDKMDDKILRDSLSPGGCSSKGCELNKKNLENTVMEKSSFQNELGWEHEIESGTCRQSISSGSSTLATTTRSSSDTTSKRVKQIKIVDPNEAVELSIAASEAVAISEQVTSLELSSAKAILEISLRVKQARTECCLETLDATYADPTYQSSETDQLSELDDNAMEDAFDDVGLCFTQVIATPDNLSAGTILSQKNTDVNSLVADLVRLGFEENCQPGVQSSKVDDTISKDKMGPRRKDLPMEVIAHGDLVRKYVPKFFVAETSSISESLPMGDSMSVHRLLEGTEKVASSRIVCEVTQRSTSEENKRHRSEEIVLSQDFVGSSAFSLIDPLCSVVPCSIPSDNASIGFICDQKPSEDTTVKCLDTTIDHAQFEGPSKGADAGPSSIFIHAGKSAISSIRDKGTGVCRKHVTSLKTYSMVMPALDTSFAGNFVLPEMNSVSAHPISTNDKNPAIFALECKAAHQVVKGPSNVCCFVGKNNDKSGGYSGGDQMPGPGPDQTGVSVDCAQVWVQHDKRCPSLVINHGSRHRVMACSTIFGGDKEEETLRESSVIKRTGCTRGKILCRDEVVVNSHTSLHSSLHPCPLKVNGPLNKRVRFSEAEPSGFHNTKEKWPSCLRTRTSKRKKRSYQQSVPGKGNKILNCIDRLNLQDKKEKLFYGFEFLLTGLPRIKKMEVEALIRTHGGIILPNVPLASHSRGKRGCGFFIQQCPIVLSPKKVQTTEFLYGCAIGTWLLKTEWLSDCVRAGSILPPRKYSILHNLTCEPKDPINWQAPYRGEKFIFDKVGIMLYGKTSFCTKFSNIIQHGGGQVFKTLQWLVQSMKNGKNSTGALIVENENNMSRHLKHCAIEHNLYTLPANWIVNSLFSGKLLPVTKNFTIPFHRITMPTYPKARNEDMSEEI